MMNMNKSTCTFHVAFMSRSSVDKTQLMFFKNLCITKNTQDTSCLTVPVYAYTYVYGVYVMCECMCVHWYHPNTLKFNFHSYYIF